MVTQYGAESDFKKKYLAPLIVLMLCAVALTGAAYAYSTSVNGNGGIDHDYYSIDMYDNEGNPATSIKSVDGFDVATTKTVGGNYYGHVDATQIKFTTYIKVTSKDGGAHDCELSRGAVYTKPESGTAELYETWTSESVNDFVFKIKEVGSEGDYADFTNEYGGKTGIMYEVQITFTLPKIDDKDLKTDAPSGLAAATAFADYILLTFTAKA